MTVSVKLITFILNKHLIKLNVSCEASTASTTLDVLVTWLWYAVCEKAQKFRQHALAAG